MNIRTPVSWMGNKTSILHILYAVFPLDYERYIEPFGGSGAVLLGKNKPDKFEVYNDFNHNLVNLFRCILHKLQNIFNYVFLPLNRNGNYLNDSKVFRRSKYLYRYDDYKNFENNYNINISTVNSLISRAINDMNMKLNDINERFNKDILKSFLDAENITDSDEIIKYLNEITNGEIDLEDVKKQYTDVLTSINLLDNQSENKIHDYFTALYRDINDFNARKENVLINLLFKLSELKKITDIISKAEENDRLKSKVMLPINNFKNTINLFFKGSFNEKQLFIYPNGTLHFRNRFGKRITLNDLSSGEKQIITFFAYLIFCLGIHKVF